MSGIALRTASLLNADTGRSVVVAFDHCNNGIVPGGGDSRAVIELLAAADIEAILVGPGLMRPLSGLLARPGAPRLIVAIDAGTFGPLPGAQDTLHAHRLWISPEEALRYGAAVVKMLLPLGIGDRPGYADSNALIARTAERCDQLGIPLMLEPAFWGKDIGDVTDEMIEHATRVCIELGAHILKIPAPADTAVLERIVAGTYLPVYMLGGPPSGGGSMGRGIVDWTAAGATGVVIGRNVWSRPNISAAVEGLRAAVHDRDADRSEQQLLLAEQGA